MKYTNKTIKLQDGTFFNFKRRFKKKHKTLLNIFATVTDRRRKQGIRHPLPKILLIVFAATMKGACNIAECHTWALHNMSWLKTIIDMSSGIPDETTIIRAIAKIDLKSLIKSWGLFISIMYSGNYNGDVFASFDGKSIRAIHGSVVGGHIVSLFTHKLHQIIGQIEVGEKTNEIPAAQEMINNTQIKEMTLIADALHAQKITTTCIIKQNANYILFIKGNQEELMKDIAFTFTDNTLPIDTYTLVDNTKTRKITTMIQVITDKKTTVYFSQQGWVNCASIGSIRRTGTRTEKGTVKPINETVYIISSRSDLTAYDMAHITRNHWSIENNLHWQKDYTWKEDRQRLRTGNAPSVMTFLRSCCIALFNLFSFTSVANTICHFQHNEKLYHTFLNIAAIV